MWDRWWHGENKSVAGLLDTQCSLCQATICSQARILCGCTQLEPLREDHLRSLATANTRLLQGPQRQLLVKYLYMVATWSPLDERVLLWTGMLSKYQRSELDTYIRRLPVACSRSLLTDTCRSLARLTRTIWEAFRTLVSEAAAEELATTERPELPPTAGDKVPISTAVGGNSGLSVVAQASLAVYMNY